MLRFLKEWFHRYFSHPEAIVLFFILIVSFLLLKFFGNIMVPVLASLVLAYLLDSIVTFLQRLNMHRLPAVLIVFSGFLGLFFLSLFVLFPLVWKQFIALFDDLPNVLAKIQQAFTWLSVQYPSYFSQTQFQDLVSSILADIRASGKEVITASLSSIASMITWVVYLVLMPFLIFFFLKDKQKMLLWAKGFLPAKRSALQRVSIEVNEQIGNYIRGKVIEILLMTITTYIVFVSFGLDYALLLAAIVGLSVLIPYVGILVATVPVALVGYFQWDLSSYYGYFMLVYILVQGFDATIIVPLLFSEAVNLHPVSIVISILFFGGIWGFWGVFFAIPLATLLKAVFYAWPRATNHTHTHTNAHAK